MLAALLIAAAPRQTGHATPARTLRIWYATDDPNEASWVQQVIQRYQKTHPGVHVSLTTYGLDDMNTKVPLALRTNTPPDLIYATPRGPGLPTYVRAGQLLDLTGQARKRGWSTALRPGLLSDYNALLAANGRPRDAGRIYAVPYVMAVVGVLYNRTIFSKLHLSVPHTLVQFEGLLPTLQKAHYTPIGFGNADGWVGDDWYLTQVNARINPKSLQAALRLDPGFSFNKGPIGKSMYDAAYELQDWSGRKLFTRDFGGLDAQDSINAFFMGHTGVQLISSSENAQILAAQRRSKLSIGVFAFPSARAKQPAVMPQSGYSGWAIPRKAHNAADALNVIDTALSAPTAQILLANGLIPAHRLSNGAVRSAAPFQRDFLNALNSAQPGVYIDSAPIPNINATMEANVQFLLNFDESADFLTRSLQSVYSSHGKRATSTHTDGEF